mgnify:CR=1 FL=1
MPENPNSGIVSDTIKRDITTAEEKLGADQIIDYNAQDFTKVVSGCDAVFDTVGGDVTQRSFAVLRPGGRAASIAAGQAAPVSPRADVTSLRPKVGRDRPHLERIVDSIAVGVRKIRISS